MSYAFTYEVPITAGIYTRIKDGIGPQRPAGLIAHLAYRTETGAAVRRGVARQE